MCTALLHVRSVLHPIENTECPEVQRFILTYYIVANMFLPRAHMNVTIGNAGKGKVNHGGFYKFEAHSGANWDGLSQGDANA